MKKLIFLVAFLVTGIFAFNQSTLLLRGDTIRSYKQADTAVHKIDSILVVTMQTVIGKGYNPLFPSVSLMLSDSTRAIRINRMFSRNNIVTPQNGMFIYEDSTNQFLRYEASAWVDFGSGGGGGGMSYSDTASMLSNYIRDGYNGITKDGHFLKLGGNLTETTTIDGQNAYDLNLLNLKNYFAIVDDNNGHSWNDYMFATGGPPRAAKTYNNSTQYEMGQVYLTNTTSDTDTAFESFWFNSSTIPNFSYGHSNHGTTNLRLRPGNFLMRLRGDTKGWQAVNVPTTSDTTWKPLAWNSSDSSIRAINYWPGGGSSDTTYVYKNTLYNEGVVAYYDNFSRPYLGSNYYSTLPATTATVDANGLNLSGGADNLLNYIQRNFNTSSENFELTLTYINNAISTTDSGVWIGVKSNNTNCCAHDIMVGVYQATGHPNLGKSFIFGRAYAYTSVGSDAISSISVGDTMQVTMKRSGLTYIVNSRNITTGETSTDTVTTTIGLTPTNFFPNNNSKPTIYFRSGDITIIGEEYRVLDSWNADYAFVGNSITQGQAATAYNLTYPNRTFESDSGISVITLAGGGDITQSIIDELPEIYKLKPRYVALMIGGNDILFGVATATWQQNLRTIRDSLVNHSIGIIHLYPTPRSGFSVMPLVDFLDTCVNFASDTKVRATFDSLVTGGTNLKAVYDAGDGTHLNDSGHHYVAIKIREAVTPHARTPIPIIPLQSLYADGYELPNAVLTNHGWDTTFRRTVSSGGGSGTPAGNFGNVQLNRSGSFATPASDSLGYTTSAGLNVKNQIQATGGLITNETLNSGYSTLIHEDLLTISTLPNASLRIGNPSTTPGSFSSFGIAPAYSGATSPTVFYMSNFPNYTGGSRQFMIYQSASGDNIIMSTSNGFGGQNKQNYHFNTTLYNGSTNASLSLLSNGNVGVNQVAPDSTFQVNGGLKFVTGRQGAGKVLTSDANGGADWQTASSSTPTLQQVTNAGKLTTRMIQADSYTATNLSNGYNFNLDTNGTFLASGWAGRIIQNNSNGNIAIASSFATGVAGGAPSYTSAPIQIRPDGQIELNTQYNAADSVDILVIDTVTNIVYRKRISGGGGGGTGSNLSWDATNHQVDIDGGGTSSTIPYAGITTDGLMSAGTQTFGGAKTFDDLTIVLDAFSAYTWTGQEKASDELTPASGSGIVYWKNDGKLYARNDGGTIYDLTAGGVSSLASVGGGLDIQSGGAGNINTLAAADFDLASNLISIDATKWLTISAAAAAYQPLDADLTYLAGFTPSANVKTVLNAADNAAIKTAIGVMKNLTTNITDVGNVGAGVDDLMTYSIPAGQLATNGDYIEFTMSITFAANANNKQVTVVYGGTTIYASGAQPQNDGALEIEGKIIRVSATTQRITFHQVNNGTLFTDYADYVTAGETLSGAVTLKATGEATSNNDIVQKILTVKYVPVN